jgi:hypothetical protein
MPDLNPRAVAGGNTGAIDYAKEESERLRRDYAALDETVALLEVESDAFPEEIPDADTKEKVVDLIKRGRDVKARVEALHKVEKEPHFRRGQGVDQFFFGLWDRLTKRDRKNRDGFIDSLNSKLTRYDVRIVAEENERRRKAFEEAERIRLKAEADRIEKERIAEEARLAAERARLPATTAAKTEVAEDREADAGASRVEEAIATTAAEDAYVSTLARPADLARTRTASGTLSTMAEEPFAEIEKAELLNMAKLWPYIAFAEKEKALRAWAKSTGHNEQMTGAKIGRRPKSRVR